MSVAVNGTEPTRVCLYMPFQTPVRSSAPLSVSLMATRAPLLRLQGPKRPCSGELNFELTCGEILLLQSLLRHEVIQRPSRAPVLSVFAVAIIVDLQK